MSDSIPSNLIIGAGRSGLAAEALLQSEGVPTSLFDEQTHTIEDLIDHCEICIDRAIMSPGFSTHPWCDVLRQYSIPPVLKSRDGLAGKLSQLRLQRKE